MTQEALKLAFEKVTGIPDAWTNPALMQARNGFIQGWEASLSQMPQEPVALETLLKWDDDIDPIGEVVGFIEGSPYIMVKVHEGKQVSLDDDLYATPPQRTEQPKVRTGDCLLVGVCASEGHKIQPQRTWVGLTDDEIAQGWKESWVTEQAFQSAVWWAEEKLKEKNGYAEEKNT